MYQLHVHVAWELNSRSGAARSRNNWEKLTLDQEYLGPAAVKDFGKALRGSVEWMRKLLASWSTSIASACLASAGRLPYLQIECNGKEAQKIQSFQVEGSKFEEF
jgi:hypothetical protein